VKHHRTHATLDGETTTSLARRLDATTLVLSRPARSATIPGLDPWGEHLSRTEPGLHRTAAVRTGSWLVPAVVMAVLGAVGLSGPALWTDELATWGMTVTPWAEMWPVLRWVDAVLAPYYAVMRLWSQLAGSSDVALRLPSLAAMISAAALVGALGARLAGPRVGLLAGLAFAVLPASTRYAQEARPHAWTVFAAALATYLLVRAVDHPVWWRFAGYAATVAVLGLLHVVAVLLLIGHG
jgi:mannosyltransferase